MREEVRQLVALGPMPPESEATDAQLWLFEERLNAVQRPVSDEEAVLLVDSFGPDLCSR